MDDDEDMWLKREPEEMHHLLYRSKETRPMEDADLEDILGAARRVNPAKGVSGQLVYRGGWFLQVLEGKKDDVMERYNHIAKDKRHTGTQILMQIVTKGRIFKDWGMGYVPGKAKAAALPINNLNMMLDIKISQEEHTERLLMDCLDMYRSGGKEMTEVIHHLLYRSKATQEVDDEMLESILGTARRNNPSRGLSGSLVYRDGWFLQVLEGPHENVMERFNAIDKDPRHEATEVLMTFDSDSRLFTDWGMGSVPAKKTGTNVDKILAMMDNELAMQKDKANDQMCMMILDMFKRGSVQMKEVLIHLLYRSKATDPEKCDQTMLDLILGTARKNNPPRGISGQLIYRDGYFLQLLEGPEDAVMERYRAIGKDPRHYDTEVLATSRSPNRLCEDWGMGYVPGRKTNVKVETLIAMHDAELSRGEPDDATIMRVLESFKKGSKSLKNEVFHLLYRSQAKGGQLPRNELDSILRSAKKNNPARGLSGQLIYRDGWFLQLLEGDEPDVMERYNKIGEDPRHENTKIMITMRSPSRLCDSWGMGHVEAEKSTIKVTTLLEVHDQEIERAGDDAKPQLITMLLDSFKKGSRDMKVTAIHHLMYRSKATREMTDKDLAQILKAARTQNPPRGISGQLVYRDGYFLQILEGPKEAVMERYNLIEEDKRHANAEILATCTSAKRIFNDWGMGHVEAKKSKMNIKVLLQMHDSEIRMATNPTPEMIASVMESFAGGVKLMRQDGVFHIIYHTTASGEMDDEELEKIKACSMRFNPTKEMSGQLIYRHPHFFQLLEGPETDVLARITEIEKDNRHTNLTELTRCTTHTRLFDQWGLFVDRGKTDGPDSNEAIIEHFIENLKNTPHPDDTTLATMMKGFMEGKKMWVPTVYHLLYRSKATVKVDAKVINKILASARKFNTSVNVSGMLLYRGGWFLQTLEGDEPRVKALYEHIEKDERHSKSEVVFACTSSKRLYDSWEMAHVEVPSSKMKIDALLADMDTKVATTKNADADLIQEIMQGFRAGAPLMGEAKQRHLLYRSKCKEIITEDMVKEIVTVSSANNPLRGLSGMLLYRDGWFLQLLEGPDDAVSACMKHIEKDKRHNKCKVMANIMWEGRLFDGMGMQCVDCEDSGEKTESMWKAYDKLLKDGDMVNLETIMTVIQAYRAGVADAEAQQVCHLLYRSKATVAQSKEMVTQILTTAKRNNPARGISGLLLSRDGYFMQCLEGPENVVMERFNKIEEDPRHTGAVVMAKIYSTQRMFTEWGMACVRPEQSKLPIEQLNDLHDDMIKTADPLTTETIMNVMQGFRAGAKTMNQGMIYHLLYRSKATIPMNQIELEKILASARKNNPSRGVSGMLLYRDGWFMQILEGPEHIVRERYETIGRDPRHEGTEVMGVLRSPNRMFTDWGMSFIDTQVSKVKIDMLNQLHMREIKQASPLTLDTFRSVLNSFRAGSRQLGAGHAYHLLYRSKMTMDPTKENWENLLKVSRQSNQLLGVSGLLLEREGWFMSMIEGDQGSVRDTYEKIKKDTRHRNVEMITAFGSPNRLFNTWGLNHCEIIQGSLNVGQLNRMHDTYLKEPTEEKLAQVLQEFRVGRSLEGDKIRHLLYRSKATKDVSRDDLEQILGVARVQNPSRGVSGLLLYRDGWFLQVLEGAPEAVQERYDTIAKDKRHHSTEIVCECLSDTRLFNSWGMGFLPISNSEKSQAAKVAILNSMYDDQVKEQGATPELIKAIMISFNKGLKEMRMQEELNADGQGRDAAVEDDGMILHLLYKSRETRPMTQEDLDDILGAATATNQTKGVSGLLLYRDGWFLQVLEGPEEAVKERYAAIEPDPRHTDTKILLKAVSQERLFTQWGMGYDPVADNGVSVEALLAHLEVIIDAADPPDSSTIMECLNSYKEIDVMYGLLYRSEATRAMSKDDLDQILYTARTNNVPKGLSGLLVYRDGWFMQLLEGEQRVVKETFDRIEHDPRHKGTEVLCETKMPSRLFDSWGMGFLLGEQSKRQVNELNRLVDVIIKAANPADDKTVMTAIEIFKAGTMDAENNDLGMRYLRFAQLLAEKRDEDIPRDTLMLEADQRKSIRDSWSMGIVNVGSIDRMVTPMREEIAKRTGEEVGLWRLPFASMVTKFGSALNSVVEGADSEELVQEACYDLAIKHMGVCDPFLLRRYAHAFMQCVVEGVKAACGEDWDEFWEMSWYIFMLDIVYSLVQMSDEFGAKVMLIRKSWHKVMDRGMTTTATGTKEEGDGLEGESSDDEEHTRKKKKRRAGGAAAKQTGALAKLCGGGKQSALDDDEAEAEAEKNRNAEMAAGEGNFDFGSFLHFNVGVVAPQIAERFTLKASVLSGRFSSFFEALVDLLGKPQQLAEEIFMMSTRHMKYRAEDGQIGLFGQAVMVTLRSMLPRVWDHAHEEAWLWLWGKLEAQMREALTERFTTRSWVDNVLERVNRHTGTNIGELFFDKFFALEESIENYFYKPRATIITIFKQALDVVSRLYHDPDDCVNSLRRIGLQHTKHSVPAGLFPYFTTALMHTLALVCEGYWSNSAEDAWSLTMDFATRTLMHACVAGKSPVTAAVIANSTEMLDLALQGAPRVSRNLWSLEIDVAGQKVSPFYWALADGKYEIAQQLLEDVLAIRADREAYYCGKDELFQTHPGVVDALSTQCARLVPVLLNGLFWSSRQTVRGRRRVNYYLSQLYGDPNLKRNEDVRRTPIGTLAKHGVPQFFSHPVVTKVSEIKWNAMCLRREMWNQAIQLLTLVLFMVAFVAIESEGDAAMAVRIIFYAINSLQVLSILGRAASEAHRGQVTTVNVWLLGPVRMPETIIRFHTIMRVLASVLFVAALFNDTLVFDGTDENAFRVCAATGGLLTWLQLTETFKLLPMTNRIRIMFSYWAADTLSAAIPFIIVIVAILLATKRGFAAMVRANAEGTEAYERARFSESQSDGAQLARLLAIVTGNRNLVLTDYDALQQVFYALLVVLGILLSAYGFAALLTTTNLMYKDVGEGMVGVQHCRDVLELEALESLDKRKRVFSSFHFEQRIDFDEGDVGITGGVPVTELAASIDGNDRVKRYPGLANPLAPWVEVKTNLFVLDDTLDEQLDQVNTLRQQVTAATRGKKVAGATGTLGSGSQGGTNATQSMSEKS